MNRKKAAILTAILLLYVTLNSEAQQTVDVKGTVINTGKEPVEGAYIEFTGDTVYRIAVSGEAGKFTVPALNKGIYQVNISHLAYDYLSKRVAAEDSLLFQVRKKTYELSEVVVTADIRKAVRMKEGNLVFDPSFLGNLKSNSIYQIMQNLPGIDISPSAITINGQPASVKINGRPTGLSAPALSAYLKSIPASKIKDITLQGASAENPAATAGGVVHINLAREEEGASTLNAGGTMEFTGKEIAGAGSFLYSMQKKNLFASGYLEYENLYSKTGRESSTAYPAGMASTQTLYSHSRANNYFGILNMDYMLRNKSLLHLNASFYYENVPENSSVRADYYRENRLTEKSSDEIKKAESGDLYRIYTEYKTGDSLKLKHNTGYGIIFGKDNSRYDAGNRTVVNDIPSSYNLAIRNRHQGIQHQIHYDMAWNPHKNTELKAGLRLDIGNLSPESSSEFPDGENRPAGNTLSRSAYRLKENIYSAYISARRRMNNITLYAGLRAEATDMSAHSDEKDRNDINWEYRKIHLFPYASLSGHSGFYSATLRFSTGIDRPSYWYYVPNHIYTSKYQYTTGNPSLRPSRLLTVDWSNLFFDFLGLDMTYSYRKNKYTPYVYPGETDFEEIRSYLNCGNEHRLRINLYLPYEFLRKRISGSLNFNGSIARVSDWPAGLKPANTKLKGFVIVNYTELKATARLSAGYSLRYQSFCLFEQSDSRAYASFDPYVSYSAGRFTISLEATDVFNTSVRNSIFYYGSGITHRATDLHRRRLNLSVRYSLSKGGKIKQHSSGEADMSRFSK
jgi:hypothetical protein